MTESGMDRDASVQRVRDRTDPWDLVVIGGGATGLGVALDAAARKLDVLLVEQSDFGKGTSSRSTKLVHGGVRYLRQGNIRLVRDALAERTLLRNNAPHLVHDMPFLIPCQSLWQRFFYGVGLKVYDFLAGRHNFGRSHGVSNDEATQRVPVLSTQGLSGGVIYHDGQFDDARLLVNMARTASDHGACLVNYMGVTELTKGSDGRITGCIAVDHETNESMEINARCIVNAAGPFCDSVRDLDDPKSAKMIAPSQGVHLVLPRSFFPGETAMIVPKTSDGRVLFIIPWHEHAIVGTTDTPIPEAILEPSPKEDEIQFLLETSAQFLSKPPELADVLSTFTGIRPLVKGDKSARTASLSRDHVIKVSASGLLTITGGKWTTVRKMAEDCVDRVVKLHGLQAEPCITKTLRLHGATDGQPASDDRERAYYGADLVDIHQLEANSPELAEPVRDSLPLRRSDVVWAVRNEMARTVEDVLARRARVLFCDARAALDLAPAVAGLMADELGQDDAWQSRQLDDFGGVAQHYMPAE